jgi:ATP-binding cassette, subfamily F, member 3
MWQSVSPSFSLCSSPSRLLSYLSFLCSPGKSTLLRIIAGEETPQQGYAEFNSKSITYNYYEQNQADALDLDRTVLETVMEGAPSHYTFTEIRSLLGQFMFKGDDVDKKIRVLSGGEKARVSLCKMMLTPCNLLLLDEPTNHLDIVSKEVLEDAIRHYEGSVLVISHDRYFMSQIANKIFAFQDKKVVRFDCDYYDYMEMQGNGLKEKVTSRYVEGDGYRITNAKEVVIEEKSTKKNFGGSGVTSGNLNKGIKNAKRYSS